jgi:hypothetical protein
LTKKYIWIVEILLSLRVLCNVSVKI